MMMYHHQSQRGRYTMSVDIARHKSVAKNALWVVTSNCCQLTNSGTSLLDHHQMPMALTGQCPLTQMWFICPRVKLERAVRVKMGNNLSITNNITQPSGLFVTLLQVCDQSYSMASWRSLFIDDWALGAANNNKQHRKWTDENTYSWWQLSVLG